MIRVSSSLLPGPPQLQPLPSSLGWQPHCYLELDAKVWALSKGIPKFPK